MSRAQTARPSPHVQALRLQHKRFANYVETLVPAVVVHSGAEAQLKPFRLPSATQTVTPTKGREDVPVLRKGIRLPSDRKGIEKRPNSSPSKHRSILHTARSIETLPPSDPRFPSAVQEESNMRLFRGSRYESGPRPETLSNPLFKYSSLVGDQNLEAKEREVISKEKVAHEAFTQSLKFLQALEFDLDLNYEIVHGGGDEDLPEPSPLGGFYLLQEELDKAVSQSSEMLLKESLASYSGKLSDYSKIVRTVLRGLRKRDLENECVMVELLWKVIVKLFDSAIDIHQHTLNEAVEMMKYRVRVDIESHRKEIEDLRSNWSHTEDNYKDQISKLDQTLLSLQAQRTKLETELAERQEELAKITEGNQRHKIVQEMNLWSRKLADYLNESEAEQMKQAAALESIEVIMEASKRVNERRERKEAEVQTDPAF